MEVAVKEFTGLSGPRANPERRGARRMVLPLSQEINLRYTRPRPTAADPLLYDRSGRMCGPNAPSGVLLNVEA